MSNVEKKLYGLTITHANLWKLHYGFMGKTLDYYTGLFSNQHIKLTVAFSFVLITEPMITVYCARKNKLRLSGDMSTIDNEFEYMNGYE